MTCFSEGKTSAAIFIPKARYNRAQGLKFLKVGIEDRQEPGASEPLIALHHDAVHALGDAPPQRIVTIGYHACAGQVHLFEFAAAGVVVGRGGARLGFGGQEAVHVEGVARRPRREQAVLFIIAVGAVHDAAQGVGFAEAFTLGEN